MGSLDLGGRVALVTGSTRGIGLAIAARLAEQGASVILNGRSGSPALAQAATDLADRFGTQSAVVAADISKAAEAAAMMQTVFKTFGRLDILVNNAGVLKDGLIGMTRENDMREMIEANIVGTFNCMQSAVRLMARTGGSIVNIASIMGLRGNAGQSVYSATKGAIIAATLSAAKELAAKEIRVNAVAPGYIDTAMVGHVSPDLREKLVGSIALRRVGTPEEVADAVLFLASDMSRYITGQVLGVDGGMIV